MKKELLFALALLIITSHGAFASCNQNTDRFDTVGWCIDHYGTFTPKSIITNSEQISSQGGSETPVLNITASPTGNAVTYDSLSSQQSGNLIVDMGNQTLATQTGFGGVYILPQSAPGLTYSFMVGSKSTITIDTLTTADSILYASIVAGNGIRNTSKAAGDSITVTSNAIGTWVVDTNGTWADSTKARG